MLDRNQERERGDTGKHARRPLVAGSAVNSRDSSPLVKVTNYRSFAQLHEVTGPKVSMTAASAWAPPMITTAAVSQTMRRCVLEFSL